VRLCIKCFPACKSNAIYTVDMTVQELWCMHVLMWTAASQERIRAVKESLQSCKNLLHCKRDELRRLWIEGVEMKTVYASLDAVEQVKEVAEQIPALITSRNYLTATELVISSLAILDTELSDVDALQQVSYSSFFISFVFSFSLSKGLCFSCFLKPFSSFFSLFWHWPENQQL